MKLTIDERNERIERAAEHWFTSGPIVPAILASAAVPGLLPPAEIDGEHFLDGGYRKKYLRAVSRLGALSS